LGGSIFQIPTAISGISSDETNQVVEDLEGFDFSFNIMGALVATGESELVIQKQEATGVDLVFSMKAETTEYFDEIVDDNDAFATQMNTQIVTNNIVSSSSVLTSDAELVMIITLAPTVEPTATPSLSPTLLPTPFPTKIPTLIPSASPTKMPSATPTVSPTPSPTTLNPTVSPSAFPTMPMTHIPSYSPTSEPTVLPTRNGLEQISGFGVIVPDSVQCYLPDLSGNGYRIRWITPASSNPLLGYHIRLKKIDDFSGTNSYSEFSSPVMTSISRRTASDCDTFEFTHYDTVCERMDETIMCPTFVCPRGGQGHIRSTAFDNRSGRFQMLT